jgi:hypothetical protein
MCHFRCEVRKFDSENVIKIAQLLPAGVLDDEARLQFLDSPRRREAALGRLLTGLLLGSVALKWVGRRITGFFWRVRHVRRALRSDQSGTSKEEQFPGVTRIRHIEAEDWVVEEKR